MISVVKKRVPKGTIFVINSFFKERKKERTLIFFKEIKFEFIIDRIDSFFPGIGTYIVVTPTFPKKTFKL